MIHVLEDMEPRVSWLRDAVGRDRVLWAADVRTFVDALRGSAPPTLVILDHDLGGIPRSLDAGSRDLHGMTGMDAVRLMPDVECMVLVWSVNPVRAPQMVADLRRRGMRARWSPFGTHECAAIIGAELSRAARARGTL